MSLDPFKKKPARARKSHIIDPFSARCLNCGLKPFDFYTKPACDPDSDEAKAYRRERSARAVYRAVGR